MDARSKSLGRRIEICGGIASGKTTLARALGETGMTCSFEGFESNPFWSAFYDDPRGNAFETEITFLLQHYHQIKQGLRSRPSVLVCDYSLLLDRAYGFSTLPADELPAFLSVYGVIAKRLSSLDLIVHLRCDATEEHARIIRRGREVERTATVDLLVRLNAAIEQQLAAPDLDVPILRIDSNHLDFTEHGADRERVVAEVRQAVHRACRPLS